MAGRRDAPPVNDNQVKLMRNVVEALKEGPRTVPELVEETGKGAQSIRNLIKERVPQPFEGMVVPAGKRGKAHLWKLADGVDHETVIVRVDEAFAIQEQERKARRDVEEREKPKPIRDHFAARGAPVPYAVNLRWSDD